MNYNSWCDLLTFLIRNTETKGSNITKGSDDLKGSDITEPLRGILEGKLRSTFPPPF